MKKILTILLIIPFCIILIACDNDEEVPKDIGTNEKATLKETDNNIYDDYVYDGVNDDLMEEEYDE